MQVQEIDLSLSPAIPVCWFLLNPVKLLGNLLVYGLYVVCMYVSHADGGFLITHITNYHCSVSHFYVICV